MTEQQRYDVVHNDPAYEIRRYHPCVVAEFMTTGSFETAGNAAFRPLFNYISGANQSTGKIAMTSPVIQESAAPITSTATRFDSINDDSHTVGFVMPGTYTRIEDLPAPNDPAVTLRAIPEQLVIVDKFSGRWSESIYQQRLKKLETVARAQNYAIAGQARFARFNPPWTPWFMRRNEIQLPIST